MVGMVIVSISFRVPSQGLLKDHAVAVSYALTTRMPPKPSYTATMDSTWDLRPFRPGWRARHGLR